MNNLFKSMMFVAAAATLFAGCSKVNNDDPIPGAPSMVWEGNDLEAVHEITDVMSIPIKIMIPGGLQNLKLEIDSPALTAEMLASVGLAPKMDLANPDNAKMEENLKALGLPAGKSIQGVTQQLFDISTLVPMIKAIYKDDSEHKFKVTVIDAKNQTITKTLKFHLSKGPAIVWDGNDLEAVHEITDPMSIKINILTAAKLEKLELEIESPALSEALLGEMGLATKMDLTNPATPQMEEALKALGIPAGAALKDTEEQLFDISTLVPMIKAIYQESSEHRFILKVTDKLGSKVSATLRFHLTGASSITYNNDADLWKNTATFSAIVRSEGDVKIEYRKKGASVWQQAVVAKGEGNAYSATIAPTWKAEGTHATGVDQFSLDNATGIFAGNTYEYRLTVASVELSKDEFTAAAGQPLPFGDMNTWSQYVGYSKTSKVLVDYPNPSLEEAFWSSGNNNMAKLLCTPLAMTEGGSDKYAHLKGASTIGIFAAGNLFTGVFEMSGLAGFARFGQVYEFTARPSALKVRYKVTVRTITAINPTKDFPLESYMQKGELDPARIFVCITDWSDRHSVHSGMGIKTLEELNPFNPQTDTKEPAEGNVIAYGMKTFTSDTEAWTELTIPILYKDKNAKPGEGKYSLIISCAASAYGDYLCGCPDNVLDVENFEWVY